jgi:hypothetical protein
MNLKRVASTLAAMLLVACLIVLTTSCGSSSSKIRFVFADYTIGGNVDVLIDDKVVATNLAYGTGTSYSGLSSGSRNIELRPTGNTSSGSDFVNTTISFQGGSNTTLVFDFVNGVSSASPFTDDNTDPTSGNIKLRFIHAASFFGNIDIYIIAPGSGISGVSPQITNLAFNAASNYQSLSAGSYEVVATFTGTQRIILDTGSSLASLTDGQIRTIVGVNPVNGSNGYTVLTDKN